MNKLILLTSTLLLSINFLFAQTQKQSMNASTVKGTSWVGIEMGLSHESVDVPYFRGNFTIPVNPSANYHYFALDRWSVFGALRTGISFYNAGQNLTSSHLGGSVGIRHYPIKAVGFFGEVEYQHLSINAQDENFQTKSQLRNLGIDIGWTWFLGKAKNIILEVQAKPIGTDFKLLVPGVGNPYALSLGVKYPLGSGKILNKNSQ